MPTKRFYRLPEEKQKIIREAAFREFARVPVDKVSINQIIKDAGISRGSFYTYFDDKWDVLACIFEEAQKEIQQYLTGIMEAAGGDIWAVLDGFMERVIALCSGTEKRDFVKNVMNHTSPDALFSGLKQRGVCSPDQTHEEMIRWMYEHYSTERMKELEYQDFFAVVQMAIMAAAVEVKGYFEGRSIEKIRENYHRKLSILKWGVCSYRDAEPESRVPNHI